VGKRRGRDAVLAPLGCGYFFLCDSPPTTVVITMRAPYATLVPVLAHTPHLQDDPHSRMKDYRKVRKRS
jgi:hypothetical protein